MKKIFFALMVVISSMAFAQNTITVTDGNFDFLKDQTEVNVELIYDNAVYQEKNLSEEQYLEQRKADISAKKSEAVWKNWRVQWDKFKSTEFMNYFFTGFNGKSKVLKVNNSGTAKYTLIIDAKWIYAGWYGGMIGSQEAKLTSDMSFVETQNPSNVLLKLHAEKIQGKKMNDQFSWEYGRIAAAYQITGKKLAEEIKKALK
jgi:hypothetical protein